MSLYVLHGSQDVYKQGRKNTLETHCCCYFNAAFILDDLKDSLLNLVTRVSLKLEGRPLPLGTSYFIGS